MATDKTHEYQCRAIIGTGDKARYFLAWPEGQFETFVMPGSRVTGEEIIRGQIVRVFADPVLVSFAQLKQLAKQMGESIIVNKKFPVVRG